MALVLWVNSHYYPVCLKEVWIWPGFFNDKSYQRDEGREEGKENAAERRKTQFILNNWLHLSKHSLLAQWSSETKSMPTAQKKNPNKPARFQNSKNMPLNNKHVQILNLFYILYNGEDKINDNNNIILLTKEQYSMII